MTLPTPTPAPAMYAQDRSIDVRWDLPGEEGKQLRLVVHHDPSNKRYTAFAGEVYTRGAGEGYRGNVVIGTKPVGRYSKKAHVEYAAEVLANLSALLEATNEYAVQLFAPLTGEVEEVAISDSPGVALGDALIEDAQRTAPDGCPVCFSSDTEHTPGEGCTPEQDPFFADDAPSLYDPVGRKPASEQERLTVFADEDGREGLLVFSGGSTGWTPVGHTVDGVVHVHLGYLNDDGTEPPFESVKQAWVDPAKLTATRFLPDPNDPAAHLDADRDADGLLDHLVRHHNRQPGLRVDEDALNDLHRRVHAEDASVVSYRMTAEPAAYDFMAG